MALMRSEHDAVVFKLQETCDRIGKSRDEVELKYGELEVQYVELEKLHEKVCEKWRTLTLNLEESEARYERLRITHAASCQKFKDAQAHVYRTLSTISELVADSEHPIRIKTESPSPSGGP